MSEFTCFTLYYLNSSHETNLLLLLNFARKRAAHIVTKVFYYFISSGFRIFIIQQVCLNPLVYTCSDIPIAYVVFECYGLVMRWPKVVQYYS